MVTLSASKLKQSIPLCSRLGLKLFFSLAVLASFGKSSWACNIPVFRYALENWPSDTFQVLVVSAGPLDETQRALVHQFQETAVNAERPANLQLIHIDLSQQNVADRLREELRGEVPAPEVMSRIDEYLRSKNNGVPQLVVFYPKHWDRIAWTSDLTRESIDRLVDSPARQEIANRLLSGDSAVWVLLECGRPEEDQAAWERLEAELKAAEQVVKLPERELIETDDFYREDVRIELKVKFSALRIARANPEESAFAALLRGSEADLAEFDEPLVIPVYGRGRTYFALVGKGINGEMIQQNGQFLCGACSCQVKQDNPGVDMLMAVNWEDRVTAQGSAEPPLPALTGVGALELAALPQSNENQPNVPRQGASKDQGSSDAAPSQPATTANAMQKNAQEVRAVASPQGDLPAGGVGATNAVTSAASQGAAPVAGGPAPTATLPVAFSWRLLAVVGGGVVLAVAILATMARGM